MDKTSIFVDEYLSHYSSEFYDPVKAHEYYLKNRELKGRSSGGLKTEAKKSAWQYVKGKIGESKKADLNQASQEHTAEVQAFREAAAGIRKEISEKLSLLLAKVMETKQQASESIATTQKLSSEKISKDLQDRSKQISENAKKQNEALSEQQHKRLEKISEDATKKIAALPPIPKGLSESQRTELAAKRSEEIAKIRGVATKERSGLSSSIKKKRGEISDQAATEHKKASDNAHSQREALSKQTDSKRDTLTKQTDEEKAKNRESTNQEREALGSNLKAAIEDSKARYESLKEGLKAKYETALDTEYQAIKNNV
jgi:hypothetical protein